MQKFIAKRYSTTHLTHRETGQIRGALFCSTPPSQHETAKTAKEKKGVQCAMILKTAL